METIIGIGNAGCNVAATFQKYNVYDVYKINNDISSDSNNYNLITRNSHQEYEETCPDLKLFFSNIKTDSLVVLSGAGKKSGICLKALEQLVNHLGSERVNVLYIRPDTEQLAGDAEMHERLVYNVLQQYVRSGMFNNMMLISNVELEKIVGDVPVRGYYEKLNELLVSTIHMTNVFEHSKAEIKTSFKKSDISRICTFGIYDLEKKEEKLFFPLDNQLEMHYYYAINEETLESDGNLMQDIKSKMREINNSSQRGSYGVYSTQYSTNYTYLISFSQKIQKSS